MSTPLTYFQITSAQDHQSVYKSFRQFDSSSPMFLKYIVLTRRNSFFPVWSHWSLYLRKKDLKLIFRVGLHAGFLGTLIFHNSPQHKTYLECFLINFRQLNGILGGGFEKPLRKISKPTGLITMKFSSDIKPHKEARNSPKMLT